MKGGEDGGGGREPQRARAVAYPAPFSVYLGIEPHASMTQINVAPATPFGLCPRQLCTPHPSAHSPSPASCPYVLSRPQLPPYTPPLPTSPQPPPHTPSPPLSTYRQLPPHTPLLNTSPWPKVCHPRPAHMPHSPVAAIASRSLPSMSPLLLAPLLLLLLHASTSITVLAK